jgi:hypothetical protein
MVILFDGTDVSGQGRSFDVSETADEIDVTTYGSDDKEFIVGMVERDSSLEVLDDDTSTTIRDAVKTGQTGSLVWFPMGTASGNPKFTVGTAVVKERSFSYPYDDVVLMSVSIRLSGAVVEGSAP